MKPSSFKLFLMLFLDQSSTRKFLIGVWIGLSFSIAVILSTLGLMDGFDRSLRQGLKQSTGEVVMHSRNGFFELTKGLKEKLNKTGITYTAPIVQNESFLIFNDVAKGVIVKGVDENYSGVVGLDTMVGLGTVAIGAEIARMNSIKLNDVVVLAFGKGNKEMKNMPALNRFKVVKIINHGVYQKDSRMIYANIKEIQNILELNNRINMLTFNVTTQKKVDDLKVIEDKLLELRIFFGPEFYFKPYWREFSSIIEAVQAEKVLISLILQVIVVISIFNVLAFIIFINERKAKELFLFKALGLSKKAMSGLWLQLVLLIWICSCPLAFVMVQFFKILLLKLPYFELPAEIYFMPRIQLHLSWMDYGFVYLLALFWIMLITFTLLIRLRRKSLLEGLRQEFV